MAYYKVLSVYHNFNENKTYYVSSSKDRFTGFQYSLEEFNEAPKFYPNPNNQEDFLYLKFFIFSDLGSARNYASSMVLPYDGAFETNGIFECFPKDPIELEFCSKSHGDEIQFWRMYYADNLQNYLNLARCPPNTMACDGLSLGNRIE